MLNRMGTEFPLTEKWTPLITKIANQNKVPVQDLIHEARLTEWMYLQKIADLTLRENWFKKSIYKSILYTYHDKMGTHSSWWSKRKVVPEKLSDSSESVIDKLIILRTFDELYYDDLVRHVTSLLRDMSQIAAEMFVMRMQLGLRWKEIKKQRFQDVPHNQFYRMVKDIKSVVVKEITCSTIQ